MWHFGLTSLHSVLRRRCSEGSGWARRQRMKGMDLTVKQRLYPLHITGCMRSHRRGRPEYDLENAFKKAVSCLPCRSVEIIKTYLPAGEPATKLLLVALLDDLDHAIWGQR